MRQDNFLSTVMILSINTRIRKNIRAAIKKKYFVYMVECKDKTLYTGITVDIERRLNEHNSSSLGAKYTRIRRPVRMIFSKKFINRSKASKEEYRIKSLTKAEKLDMI